MLDCTGKELSIGDKVVCADMKYADLLIGEIVGFTPKKARVLYKRSEYGEAYGVKGQKEQLKESYQIFKYVEVVRCKDMSYAEQVGAEADHLIANGVTVQGDKDINVPSKWISVKDRLPTEEAKAYEKEWEDYPEYIVMIDRGYLPTTLYYDWENNEWFKINTALKREKYKVTYWMDMPQPPEGE